MSGEDSISNESLEEDHEISSDSLLDNLNPRKKKVLNNGKIKTISNKK